MATKSTPMLIWQTGLTFALSLMIVEVSTAGIEVQGELFTAERKHTGLIRWSASQREKGYFVKNISGAANAGVSAVEFFVPLGQVKSLKVAEPNELRLAVRRMRENKPPLPIVELEKLAQDYAMLSWDLVATRWLAEAYLRDGKPDLAVRACERVKDGSPDADISSEMAPWYWQALLAAGRNSKLEDLLLRADKSSLPEGQAQANILRGEMLRKQGRSKDALRDGYLRTVVLFNKVRDPEVRNSRAESLFKAAQCFEDLGMMTAAEKMRKICISEHAESEWARQLKAGER